MYKKPVIVFEGIEGSGKSSHIEFVSKYLKEKKIKYIKFREPGGSKNSEKIRSLILDKKSKFNKNTDLLLRINFLIFSAFKLPPGSRIFIWLMFFFFKYLETLDKW